MTSTSSLLFSGPSVVHPAKGERCHLTPDPSSEIHLLRCLHPRAQETAPVSGLPFPQAVLCAGTLRTQPQIQRQASLPLYLCDRGSRRAGLASQRQAQDSLSHQAKDFSESLCFPFHFLPSPPHFTSCFFFLFLHPLARLSSPVPCCLRTGTKRRA